jgi:hypothetical protein
MLPRGVNTMPKTAIRHAVPEEVGVLTQFLPGTSGDSLEDACQDSA